jgi:hypothetical protein
MMASDDDLADKMAQEQRRWETSHARMGPVSWRRIMRKGVITLILTIAVVIAGIIAGEAISKTIAEHYARRAVIEELFAKNVRQMTPTLPLRINDATTMIGVASNGMTLTYTYRIDTPAVTVPPTIVALKTKTAMGNCSSEWMRKALEAGAKLQYVYVNIKGQSLTSFEISKADCASGSAAPSVANADTAPSVANADTAPSVANADQVVTCTADNLPKTTFLIKGPQDNPSQIIWPGSGYVTTYAIKEYSDAHYVAVEQEPKHEDAASKIYINRLNGKVVLENYISHQARKVLVKRCNGEITRDACVKQQEGLQGGNLFACSPGETQCARWRNGSNLLSNFFYSCVSGARTF